MASAVNRVLHEDVGRLFTQPAVQRLLTAMTGFDVERVYSSRRSAVTRRLNIRLMTDQELEQASEASRVRSMQKLQMPPVLPPRVPVNRVLSQDPLLAGLNSTKFVFTDISPTVSQREREVVVREPNGSLRSATWEERDRINQVYFPVPGRKLRIPRLFEQDNLSSLLSKGSSYEYVLDSACVQFEPDDPSYLKVVHTVYDHCDSRAAYDDLRCTRHFGGFTFYLACSRRIDGLLLHMLQRGRLGDAACLVKLFCIVWPDFVTARSASMEKEQRHGSEQPDSGEEKNPTIIKSYLASEEMNAAVAPRIELALQALEASSVPSNSEDSSRAAAGITSASSH